MPQSPKPTPNRFDYVAYDEIGKGQQAAFKQAFQAIESMVEKELPAGRAKALTLTSLEESYMWVGKAIRDAQIDRNGKADLEEQRSNG